MKNEIYSIIQKNKNINFNNLLEQSVNHTKSKQDLGITLRELEKEKLIFSYEDSYYDLSQFESVEGFAQWNLNGFCWLSNNDKSNDFGITFDTSNELLSIYNKKDCFYASSVKGKKININDKEFIYITDSFNNKNLKVVATYNKEFDKWIILNSNTSFSFKNKLKNINDGDIAVFDYSTNDLIESLGNKNTKGIESNLISILSDIKEAPIEKIEYKEVKNKNKIDLEFYTIDSIYTSDVDDAIHIEKKNNEFILHVAIADVSSYVEKNSIQDIHAANACNSFYLPHKTVHMLDRKLAENFCSLNVGDKKSSLVCKMIFNNEGKLISKEFSQAEININTRLSYNDVDRILNQEEPIESNSLINNIKSKLTLDNNHNLIKSLLTLKDFSDIRQINQMDRFNIESTDYQLNEHGKIDHIYVKNENITSQKMVESAMLAANIAAAEFLFDNYPSFGIFRNQVTPEDLDKPKPAFYDFNNEGHWGLQTNFYTHFTSPIRRYCDLIVHRLIKGIINNNEKSYSNESLEIITDRINEQQYKSKQISIKAKNLLTAQYIEELYLNNKFDQKLNIIDYSKSGISCRNGQNIDIYIPYFKLESYVTRILDKALIEQGESPTIEQKNNTVSLLNDTWEIYMQFGSFSWTDERKNIFYQFQRKEKKKTFSI